MKDLELVYALSPIFALSAIVLIPNLMKLWRWTVRKLHILHNPKVSCPVCSLPVSHFFEGTSNFYYIHSEYYICSMSHSGRLV
jgi:hypothetical protein